MESEIEAFGDIYINPAIKLNSSKEQKHLYKFTDYAVERFKAIKEEEKKDEFKKGLRTWTNLYSFLAQIMPFTDVEFEKFFAYAKLLQTRLPKRDISGTLELDDEVALEYYRLQKIKEGAIPLVKGEHGELSGVTEVGLKRPKDEEADRLFFEMVETELVEVLSLQLQAKANKLDTFKYVQSI